MSQVLCAGIVVADHVCTPITHVPAAGELVMADGMMLAIGGCAANAAVDLAKMNVHGSIAGRVGDDAFGRIVRELLEAYKIDTAALIQTPGKTTSQTMIVNVAGEDRRFIHIFGANDQFTAADIPAMWRGQETTPQRDETTPQRELCKVLYVGGYLIMPNLKQEALVPVLEEARKAGVKTVLDVATPGKADYVSRLEKLLPHVDVFLPNQDEAALILNEHDPVLQAEAFCELGAKTAVVTMGGDGAVLVSERIRLQAQAYSVDFVDGSGGGDAFDAGFIYGLLHGLDDEGCLRVASALGASCVRAIGTTPGVFTEAECREFMQKNPLKVERI